MNIRSIFDAMRWCNDRSGNKYCWNCYGDNAFYLDFHDEKDTNRDFAHVVYDITNGDVYQIACFPKDQQPILWVSPARRQAHIDEAAVRSVNWLQAWDDVLFTEVTDPRYVCDTLAGFEFEEHIEEEQLEGNVTIPIRLPKEMILELAMMAHERDITLNQLIVEILTAEIERIKLDL